jgi:signal transduction histidine kinase
MQFDLNEAIDKVIVLGRCAVIKNRGWVQTRLSEGLVPIHGDRVQLQQVVLNLPLNAVEAMGSVEGVPRELLISTEQDHTGRPCGGARFRARPRSVASRARVRCILHHEVQRHGDGAVDLPVYRRRPWGPAVGRGE